MYLNIFSELEPYFNGSKRDTIGSIEDERDMLLGIQNNLSEILKGDNLEKLFDKDADNKVEKKEIKQVVKEEMTPEEKAKIKSDIEEAVTNEDINAEFREPTGMYNIPAATTQIFSNNRKKENLGTAVQKKLDEKMRQIMGN